jgi:hypothetical protein
LTKVNRCKDSRDQDPAKRGQAIKIPTQTRNNDASS